MQQMQCPSGHVYTAELGQEAACPVCAQRDAELLKTRAVYDETRINPGSFNRTIGVYDHLDVGIDPVVGWVACTDGPDKGRDWRLVAGRNSIGRNEGMQVRLEGDRTVSGDRHAFISFEPRRAGFTLLPGDSRGLVYLNGEEVAMPTALNAYDRVELGRSVLIFVPLAGAQFRWPDETD